MNSIITGECLSEMKKLPDNSVDSIVTDPPYGLNFMGKKWDYDVPSIDIFKEMLRIAKPGTYILCFGGSRTYHRMAVNIEDAGWEIRDTLQWIYGSGFPKSLDVSKAIDKKMGAEREVVGKRKVTSSDLGQSSNWNKLDTTSGEYNYTSPSTEQAQTWDGWGTALKPAYEPIILARKPIEEKTIAENVLKHGTGGINIDESRIGYKNESDKRLETRGIHKGGSYKHPEGNAFKKEINIVAPVNNKGRFPANVILTHHPECEVDNCHEDCPIHIMDTQSGVSKSGTDKGQRGKGGIWHKSEGEPCGPQYGDKGGASRFFYCAKASKSERGDGNIHPTVKPIKLMEYLVKLITPKDGVCIDPFAGSGSTLVACKKNGYKYIGIEREKEYCDIILDRLRAIKISKLKKFMKKKEK